MYQVLATANSHDCDHTPQATRSEPARRLFRGRLTRMLVHRFVLAASFLLAVCTGMACGSEEGGGIGSPCDDTDDCADELTCDVHGEVGTCQVAHDHDEDTESGTTS